MSEINFTKEQKSAIFSRGGNILVSAAAGSGKTAVLTERVIQRLIFDKNPIPADRLMIVTFTRASAAEMKARIMSKLSELSAKDPENSSLRRQINLFNRARIGTIHSCCVEILRDNFNLLDLPSDFRMGENDEIKKIQINSVNEVLEEKFTEGKESFLELSDLFGGRKDNNVFCSAILEILNFARSVPFYKEWLKKMPSMYALPEDDEKTEWEKLIFSDARAHLITALSFFNKALDFCSQSEELKGYEETIEEDCSRLEVLSDALSQMDLNKAYDFLESFKFGTLKAARKASPEDRDYVKALREEGKESIETIREKLILSDRDNLIDDLKYFKPLVEELFSTADKVDDIIFSKKMKEKLIDFSDLEQLSLKLLLERDEKGNVKRTEAAEKISSCIDEIMIDEYQDVNEVQDAILKALSNNENRFMVGDVKQSIYRFRQACPALFINMLNSYHSDEEESYPKKVLLNGNFRTRKEITDFINFVFGSIMTENAAEIEYNSGHQLLAMAETKSNISTPVEIDLVLKSSGTSSAENEASVVAGKIKELLNSGITIKEKDIERPLLPSDIAILMRSPKNKAAFYENALLALNIKSSALKEDDFMTSFEIKPVLNLLSAICNPAKSPEMTGAMLSPLFGFTDEEMAEIKLRFPAKNLYTSLSKCDEEEKAGVFKKYFDSLISFSKTNTPSSLISKIFYDTGYREIISAMENGTNMAERLDMLLVSAENLKSRGVQSLNVFLKALDTMRDNALSPMGKASLKSSDAVTITSIHSSKGLEWPVVFLCETASAFSFYQNDMVSSYILDKDLGFASLRRDKNLRVQFPTIPLAASRSLTKKLSLAEEMRLLYVALTRSKEKLIITGSVSDFDKKIDSNLYLDDEDVLPYIVYSRRSYLDWILTGLKYESSEELRNDRSIALNCLLPIENIEEEEEEKPVIPSDKAIMDDIRNRLSYIYPYQKASVIPSKIAASQLSGNLRSAYAFSKKPEFMKGGKEGSRRGNAFHKFMQLCSFTRARDDAENEAKSLISLNLMDEDEVSLLDFKKIETLLKGPIGELIFSSDKILREYRFFAPATVSPISKELCDDKGNAAVLEGVADLITIKDGKINIIDYKTDRVNSEEDLRSLYKNQVLLYKDMLSYSFSLPCDRVYLYSFHLQKEILI